MNGAAAVIVAAGRGVRAGGDMPKQWQALSGRPIFAHTLDAFASHPGIAEIVLVINPQDRNMLAMLDMGTATLVEGGADRAASVRNGLDAVARSKMVLIHDVARPLVTAETISNVIAALDKTPGAAPALPVTDALWTGADGQVTGTQDRTGLYRAQTPQGFHLEAIRAAHAAHPGGAADDVEVARAHGLAVAIVPGDEDNLKITMPADFARADRILRGRDGH
ncbi:2-C-methyl-D-erythritol 4-phosphate cytidylyltransferase [Tateyamaria omphalii]|uniref:2-C-methyl-D-erythritol 4-phosphate cytidylyltransferase n=1 Tax=Tateyamaria omphalii TaxID=299262 RepID=A0A1P8N0H9_9RHOB|nr:2-C-methyl-D-erythritol 4-phosphate cytidylyltransferase [Tateyamaria omphalii]APX13758.1 2-C-methyl-D-erythritol 4-phosphate cytidylyltransferase [Tateyamaria omphalii]